MFFALDTAADFEPSPASPYEHERLPAPGELAGWYFLLLLALPVLLVVGVAEWAATRKR